MTIKSSRIFNTKGYTLVEITLVLGLTLMLITALLVGISSFQDGANRAQCIMQLTSAQKSMRALMNMYEFRPEDTFDAASVGLSGSLQQNVFGDKKFIATPFNEFICPKSRKNYSGGGDEFPVIGEMWLKCDVEGHVPKDARNM